MILIHEFLDVLPWNYPIYLAFKIGLPAIITGNPILVKSANSVPLCAQALEDLYIDA